MVFATAHEEVVEEPSAVLSISCRNLIMTSTQNAGSEIWGSQVGNMNMVTSSYLCLHCLSSEVMAQSPSFDQM